jgi:hypothetical protein
MRKFDFASSDADVTSLDTEADPHGLTRDHGTVRYTVRSGQAGVDSPGCTA